MKKVFILKIAILLFILNKTAYSQSENYYFNKFCDVSVNNFINNPAYTGLMDEKSIYLGYQSKWLGSEMNQYNTTVAYDQYIGEKKFIALGFYYNYYNSKNFLKTKTLDLSFSLNFNVGDDIHIRWGSTLMNANLNTYERIESLTLDYYMDPVSNNINSYNYLNLNTGFWIHYKNIYTSIAIKNIYQLYNIFLDTEYQSYYSPLREIPIILSINSGIDLNISKKIMLQPNLQFDKTRNENILFSPTMFLNYSKKYILGISYLDMRTVTLNGGIRFLGKVELSSSIGIPTNNMYLISPIGFFMLKIKYHI